MLGLGNRFFGTVTPIAAPLGTLARKINGYLSIDVLTRALNELEPILASDVGLRAVVLEGLAITGFEPGMPMRVVQWLARMPQLQVALAVTTSPVLVATTRASRLLLPQLYVDALPVLSEAFRVSDEQLSLHRRVTTGVQRRVSLSTPSGGLTRRQTG